MRRLFVAFVVTLLLVLLPSGAAGAQDGSIVVDGKITAEPGTLIEIGRMTVSQDLVGPLCTWSITITNQESPHPGNDLVVRSGGEEFTVAGIEDTAGAVITTSGSVLLADEVVAYLRMGPDGVFSGTLTLTIDYASCVPIVPPTEAPTVPPTEAPTVPPTEAPTVPPTDAPPTAAPTVPPTEAPPLGPTVAPKVAQSTTAPSTTVAEPDAGELAVTGSNTATIAAIGAVLLACGAVLVARSRIAS